MSHNVQYSEEYLDKEGRKIEIKILSSEGFLFGKWICECGKNEKGTKAFKEIERVLTAPAMTPLKEIIDSERKRIKSFLENREVHYQRNEL